jgi:hypothetical protein
MAEIPDWLPKLLVALIPIVFGLLRWLFVRRARASNWDNRRHDIYEQIEKRLYDVKQIQQALSADEDVSYNERKYSDAETDRMSRTAKAAEAEIKALLEQYRHRFAPRAREILDAYFQKLKSDDLCDTTVPQTLIFYFVSDAYRDWGEFIPSDVGPELGVHWRIERFRRWARRKWWRLWGWYKNTIYRLDNRIEDFGMWTGRWLTQDDVRNPPRGRWETVEQMKGAMTFVIQRRLHEQLAADPPPWLPVRLSPPLQSWRKPQPPSPRLHDRTKEGPLRSGDAADTCSHGVPLTEPCRPCGFVVLPRDFAWGTGLPEDDKTHWHKFKKRKPTKGRNGLLFGG